MNFETIDNVQDLIKANNEVPDEQVLADKIVEDVLEQGWIQGHRIITRLLQAELSLHQKWMAEAVLDDEGYEDIDKRAFLAGLVTDVGHLETSLNLLQKVDHPDMSDDEDEDDAE